MVERRQLQFGDYGTRVVGATPREHDGRGHGAASEQCRGRSGRPSAIRH
jgi:hypothetical protein